MTAALRISVCISAMRCRDEVPITPAICLAACSRRSAAMATIACRSSKYDATAIAVKAASSSRTSVTGNLTAIDWRDHNDTAQAYMRDDVP